MEVGVDQTFHENVTRKFGISSLELQTKPITFTRLCLMKLPVVPQAAVQYYDHLLITWEWCLLYW